MNEWSFDPKTGCHGESQNSLGWDPGTALVGAPRDQLTLAILGFTGVGDLDAALDGEFRNWLEWGDDCDVACGEKGVMFRGLPGKGELWTAWAGGTRGWLEWKNGPRTGEDERSWDYPGCGREGGRLR